MLNTKANSFNPEFFEKANAVLDQVEATEGPGVFVAINRGKIFSAGLDLKFIKQEVPKNQTMMLANLRMLMARIMKLPMPTMAVVRGHCIAGGVMLALAFDKAIMLDDPKLKVALTEIEVGIDFPYGLMKHILGRTNNSAGARLLCGHLFHPQDCFKESIV